MNILSVLLGSFVVVVFVACAYDGAQETSIPRASSFTSNPNTDFPQASSRELLVCPYGHASLKDVPILYGLLVSDDALEKAIADYEVWPGGCVVSPTSPKWRVVCTECGASFFESSRIHSRRGRFGFWTKTAGGPAHFLFPISEALSGFPLPNYESDRLSIDYSESIRNDTLLGHDLTYRSRHKNDRLLRDIEVWIGNYSLEPVESGFEEFGTSDYESPRFHLSISAYKKLPLEIWLSERASDKGNTSVSEPNGAPNESQPIRSETNSTSSAAGSRR